MQNTQLTYSPIDGSLYVERPLADRAQIQQAITSAARAQKQWRQTGIAHRAAICSAMLECFLARSDEIAEQLCWMMGRPIRYARGEVNGTADRARYMIEIAEQALADIRLPEKDEIRCYIKREPLGLVYVIAPWNYPYLTAINTVVPALMAGNGVLLKHAPQTPLCAEQLVESFREAGLPDGLFQFLHLSSDNAQWLAQQAQIDHVAFTGSVATGRKVEQALAGRFTGLGLELGGKDPAYIRADADLGRAVETVIDGAMFNSGQSCCSIERIYVHRDLYPAFIDRAVNLVKHYRLGRPDDPETTLGPMVSAGAADLVRAQIAEALAAGAEPLVDPALFPLEKPGSPYMAPQLLVNVNHKMLVMREESFAPLAGIMPVDDDRQAIQLMNDSEFGLSAAVFSRDLNAAEAIGQQLETGTFFVNRCDYLEPGLAWTG
ncbi:aldehyde dehydrogenase family protein [Microbulbifer taiwanensis]